MKLLQKVVAKQLGVCQQWVYNWKSNRSQPDIRYISAIIRFLGYNPLPGVDGPGARLVQRRTMLGLSQKEAAKSLGSTPARWRDGSAVNASLRAGFAESVKQFLDAVTAEDADVRRAG